MADQAEGAEPSAASGAVPATEPADAMAELEARLQQVLDPYRNQLEPFAIYGMPMLRRPGARPHDWFAGVRLGFGAVKFSLLPMHARHEVLEDASPRLLKRRTGASVFMFRDGDEDLMPELERVSRAFDVYMGRAADG